MSAARTMLPYGGAVNHQRAEVAILVVAISNLLRPDNQLLQLGGFNSCREVI